MEIETDDRPPPLNRPRHDRRPRHRRHDLRLVRRPDHEAAEQARRRRSRRQLRHRAGHRRPRRRLDRRRRRRRGRGDRLHRRSCPMPADSARRRRRERRGRDATDPELTALRNRLDRRRRPRHPGPGDVDDQHAAVRQLAVAHAHAGLPGRPVGGVAVPPRRLDEPPPRRRHHGHADLRRHARRVRLERLRPVLGRGRRPRHDDGLQAHPRTRRRPIRDLPRGGLRGHRVHPRRPLLRSPRQAHLRRRAASPARTGRQGRRRAP